MANYSEMAKGHRNCKTNDTVSSQMDHQIISAGSTYGSDRSFVRCRSIFLILILYIIHLVTVAAEKEPVDFEDQGSMPRNSTAGENYKDLTNPDPLIQEVKGSGDVGFIHAFVASLSVIIVSELGDKTFFIAAIMAMRHPRLTVFLGAMLALAVMTILSACLGFATTIVPRAYTYYISTALFALFGLKMLKEGYYMSPHEGQEEYEEVQADLRKRDDELEKQQKEGLLQDVETGVIRGIAKRRIQIMSLISRIFLQAFTLTFLAEWGDRSQLTTIILAAREDVVGVTIGGIVGHGLCTTLAVMGGRIIAQKISVRTVTLIGGVVFILFAVSALFMDPSS